MRTSAFATAILALTILPACVVAEDDFSALLADLSFGNTPSLGQTAKESLTPASEAPVTDLQPAPEGLVMPQIKTNDPPLAPQRIALQDVQAPPRVALQPPIASGTPAPQGQAELDAAIALDALRSPTTAVSAQAAGHVATACESEACDMEPEITCRPWNPVRLPSSSLAQYFRSNPCYTNVWDGYQRHCGSSHKHLHGECDCFKNDGKRNGCASCDGGCGR
jgi:hypothetical protein